MKVKANKGTVDELTPLTSNKEMIQFEYVFCPRQENFRVSGGTF